jgi:glycosyltransferase involved in cell wall biosynthesis
MVPNACAASAGSIVMFDEVRSIAEAHDVTLVTLSATDDDVALGVLRDMRLRVHAIPRHRDDGIAGFVRRAAVGMRWKLGDEPFRTTLFRERGVQRALDRLKAIPFDVVHVLDNAMACYDLPGARATVLTEYEVRTDADDGLVNGEDASSPRAREAERRRWWHYQSAVWSRFDRVQVFTDADAASIHRIAPHVADRVRVNPFGAAVPDLPGDVNEREDSIVFVGGFRHPPNVEAARWLIDDILPRIRSHRPGVRVTVVGADPPPLLRARATESITITGRVERVEPFVAAAAVVVAPVRSGGGMRLKVLQAMALGRPVVTTSRGAAGVWNPPDAPTIRVADEAAGIAAHAVALLESATERAALGARARDAVRAHHSPGGFAERLRSLYAELPRSGAAA